MSEVEHSSALSLSQRERLVFKLMHQEMSRSSSQTPDSYKHDVRF